MENRGVIQLMEGTLMATNYGAVKRAASITPRA